MFAVVPSPAVPARLLLSGLLLLAAGACSGPGAEVERGPVPVILISIDTLRADRTNCYGHHRATTPELAASLCTDGVVFETAIAQAPSTLPSHASMLTGLLPAHHGGAFSRRHAVPRSVTTLAELLADAGYRTAAFHNGGQVAARWGLSQGFETYRRVRPDLFAPVVAAGLEWLDERLAVGEDRRLFLFLHTYEPHHPYTPSEDDLAALETEPYDGPLGRRIPFRLLRRINGGHVELSAEDRAFIEIAYEAEIHSLDRALGSLVRGLADRGLLDRALVIFTSDHGEEFGEHGRMGWHSHTLYDELLRVPLVIHFPGARHAGRRLERQVRLTDVVPTVLHRLGLPIPPGLDGTSLLPLLEDGRGDGDGDGGRRLAVSELDGGGSTAIRSRRWKLYDDRLYDLAEDPGETRDVRATRPNLAAALAQSRVRALAGERPEGEGVELDEEAEERLRALGYL